MSLKNIISFILLIGVISVLITVLVVVDDYNMTPDDVEETTITTSKFTLAMVGLFLVFSSFIYYKIRTYYRNKKLDKVLNTKKLNKNERKIIEILKKQNA